MSFLDNLKTDTAVEDSGDSLGGSKVLDSGLYESTIALAYYKESQGGALSLNVDLTGSNGESFRQTFWVTSGKAKGQKNYYEGKDGKKRYLPGFNAANHLCLLTVGKEISDLEPEAKVIKLYDPAQSKEVPTEVKVITDLIGTQIIAGVIKQIVDKNVKDSSGAYVASGETREENEVDKFFRASDRLTVSEIKAEQTEADFIYKWEEKNKGVVRNKAKGAKEGGSTGAATGGETKTKSLFG